MSERRIIGEHFTKEGVPKKSFPSQRAAYQFAYQRGLNVKVYLCSFCGRYHMARDR